MEEKVFLDYEHGKLCAVFNSIPGKNLALLCHGLASSKDSRSNQALRQSLPKQGIATLAMDFYAHGESDGNFEQLTVTKALEGVKTAYDYAKDRGYTNIAIIGSSFSGVVGLIAAAKLHAAGLVLKCPVFDYKKLWHDRLGEQGLRDWRKKGTMEIWKKHLGYGFYEDALNYHMPEITGKIKVPGLIVHGTADMHVPLWHARQAYAHLAGEKTLHLIDGADHFFKQLSHFKELVSTVDQWIKAKLE